MHRTLRDVLGMDFSSFIAKCFATVNPATPYLPNWHIDLIAEYLEAARSGEVKRLIINMPPRAMKSLCVSVAWPAWLLGHQPASRVIAASYAASLSIKHSLDCRLVVNAPWYRELFPQFMLSRDQNEKHKFITSRRGFRYAASVGGAITGEGGDFLVIDDPINPTQAMSEQARAHVHRWFDHTFASRLDDKGRGAIVLVMQRLHRDDLSGYLLARGNWQHLCLPAIAFERTIHDFGNIRRMVEAGELLHPMRETLPVLETLKMELGSAAFAAQYQQQPVPDEGVMIRPGWLRRYEELPALPQRIVQSWDTAIKAGTENDASVCITFAEIDQHSYVLDVISARLEYPDLKQAFYRQAERWKPDAILIEDKASGQSLLQDIKRETRLPVIPMRPKTDKVTRFAAVTALIEAGRLLLPRQAAWLAYVEEELLSFPQGRHDDAVDALSQYLDWMRQRTADRLGIRRL